MSDAPTHSSASDIAWPPTLRAEVESTPVPRRPWYLTVGPAYLTLFVWAPFFDPLWRHDLTRSGLLWMAGTAIVAAALCYALFYYPAAMWGFRTGRRLGVVAAATFGTTGSDWLTGVILAAAEIVWYAVAIDYAIQATFLGLIDRGLLPPAVLSPWPVGPALLRNPVFLGTAVFWLFITGMVALMRLTAVIAALMKVYAPVALALLIVAALCSLPGLSDFSSAGGASEAAGLMVPPRLSAMPIFLGFFSFAGLMSVEWGAASARRRDVVLGGLNGIVLAGSTTAILSLLVVAGAMGRVRTGQPVGMVAVPAVPALSFRWGVVHGMGGGSAAAVLILLGLASLAPACYSSFVAARKLFARWPGIRRVDWIWIVCTVAFFLVATGWPGRLEAVDHVMGILFAPIVGAMAGDSLGRRGVWAGVRAGIHAPGAIAWGSGVAARLIIDLLADRGRLPAPALIASPIAGFLVAALTYWILARAGFERPAVPVETYPAG